MKKIIKKDITLIVEKVWDDWKKLQEIDRYYEEGGDAIMDYSKEAAVAVLESIAFSCNAHAQDLRARPAKSSSFLCPDMNYDLRREEEADGWG